jgi:hypothetical protein
VYCRLPYNFKLNRSVFRKAVVALAPRLRGVADANTGAAPDAVAAIEWLRSHQLRLQRTWRRLRAAPANDGSWPDWQAYLSDSPGINALWNRANPDAMRFFRRVLGPCLPADVQSLKRQQPFLFVGLLTIKLWLDQRAGCNA